MVLADNNGARHSFTCEEWALVLPTSGWRIIESNCGASYYSNAQAPYAAYNLPEVAEGDKNYVHDQYIPLAEWVITHNLGKYPSCTVVDTAGSEWEGDVLHINNNTLKITFNAAFSGLATLN